MNLFQRIGLICLCILAMNGIAWVISKINHTSLDSGMILVLVGIVAAISVEQKMGRS